MKVSIPFLATLDIVKADQDETGRWIVEGFASTSDRDLQDEIVSQEAIDASAKDLLKNSTVLHNHHQDEEIGKVEDSEARKGGLWIKVLISKTVPDTWTKIKEGVLNKFSIRGKVLDAKRAWDQKLGRFVKVIKRMLLVEVSLVAVPANPNARALRWYIQKALHEWENDGGELETEGGQDMGGTATTDERLESEGMPDLDTDETAKARGEGQGVGGPRQGDGGANTCICPKCGETISHDRGTPCQQMKCPKCGTTMTGKSEKKEKEEEEEEEEGKDKKKSEGDEIGFPPPSALRESWGAFCNEKGIADETDAEKVFDAWVEYCKANRYPQPYPYPYPYPKPDEGKQEGGRNSERLKEATYLLDKLITGEKDDKRKGMLREIKALLSRMMGGAYPYPTPYPLPKKSETDEAAKADKGKGDDDLEKAGAKISKARLKTLTEAIEKLRALVDELSPEASKSLEDLAKSLSDEAKAEETIDAMQKALAEETKKTFTDLLAPITERLERIEKIEGIKKSADGQERSPDEKGKAGGKGKKKPDEKEDPKGLSAFHGILGGAVRQARSGFGEPKKD